MKREIVCPSCIRRNKYRPKENQHKPQVLGKYEDVVGRGDLYLWCKACRKEIHIRVDNISLDK